MNVKQELVNAARQLKAMTFYERVEQLAVLTLSAIIAIVVLAALWNLVLRVVVELILNRTLDPTNHAVFQSIFGAIFTVIIALEFKRSILVATKRTDTVFQVKTVVLIALLAVLRKFIIIDISAGEELKLIALSLAALSLGAVYWSVRDQDGKLQNRMGRARAAAGPVASSGDAE